MKSDSEITEIVIEDDGPGYPSDILTQKIGEPYLKTYNLNQKSKSGLGLGIFIGKTLLEKTLLESLVRTQKIKKVQNIR